MFFPRMCNAGRGGGVPGGQRRSAFFEIRLFERAPKPIVECGRWRLRFRAKHSEVVVTRPAADDQYAFVAQRSQGAPGGQMRVRSEPTLQRELYQRNAGIRINHSHRHEGAVIEAARRIEPCSDTRTFE